MSTSTTITIRVERLVKEQLEVTAKRMKRSKSFVAAAAIEEYLAVQEWQVEGVTKAIAAIDAGKRVAHSDVVDWVKSWGSEGELKKPTT